MGQVRKQAGQEISLFLLHCDLCDLLCIAGIHCNERTAAY